MTSALTPKSYMVHHLTNWTQTGHPQKDIVDFSLINIDTLIWSLLAATLILCFLGYVARKITSGVPNRWQAAVELLIEFVTDQSKIIVGDAHSFVAPLALTVFLWIGVMNTFDLLPVDLMPRLIEVIGLKIHYMRVVPTADLNATLAMALGVMVMSACAGISKKRLSGFCYALISTPFGQKPWLWLFNLLLNFVEYAAKTLSLSMRLFGNMLAGEVVFCLIAMLGTVWTGYNMVSFGSALGSLVSGVFWAVFHLLIILLQAFIFMMLTLVYISQACDHH